MKLKTIIIEDELPAQKVLLKYMADTPQLELIGTFNNAISAISFLQENIVDLVFLDIHLPKLSGLDFLRATSHPPLIIITSAFSDYAIEGYELNVVDYLLKPFSFQRFIQAVSKVLLSQSATVPGSLIQNTHELQDFFIKVDKTFYRISTSKIIYLKSDLDFVKFYTDTESHMVLKSLKHYEQFLPSPPFLRVHKSYLVNLKRIDMIHGNTIRIGKIHIPVGRNFKLKLMEAIEKKS